MARRYCVIRHSGMPRRRISCVSLPIVEDGGTPAGGCAGGNRFSGGAPGNGAGREAASLDYVLGPREEWEAPALSLRPDQVDWLSHDDRKLVFEDLAFRVEDVLHQLQGYNMIDGASLRDFFMNDYMRCMYLISELDFRLNKIVAK